MRIVNALVFILMALMSSLSWAHRPVLSAAEARAWGFKPRVAEELVKLVSGVQKIPYEPFSLPLPVPVFAEDPVRGILHQLQDYTKPDYYHAGVDLRTEIHQVVRTPVAGRIEAGYYAYTDEENGQSAKVFISYEDVLRGQASPPCCERYFELAVIDDYGYRFEFHHIDAKVLSSEIVQKILLKGRVSAREEIGKVIRWGAVVTGLPNHHLHYSVISPEGHYLNPLFLSEKIDDGVGPVISYVHSVQGKICSKNGAAILDKIEKETHGYFVVETKDFIRGRYYANPPARLTARFRNWSFEWDFTRSLEDGQTGLRPDIRDYYLQQSCNLKEIPYRASSSSKFMIKVPVPAGYGGPVELEVFDVYGNSNRKTVEVRTPSI